MDDEQLLPPQADNSNHATASLFELLDDGGLIGCVKDAAPDLSNNPKYMEGFGTAATQRHGTSVDS